MLTPTTYLEFHAVFVVPILGLVLTAVWARGRRPATDVLAGSAILVALAVAYTTPWANWLIATDVWWYGDGVTATRIRYVPLGEYFFFILQTVVTVLWASLFAWNTDPGVRMTGRDRVVGAVAGAAVAAVGVALLLSGGPRLYLGAILAWAGPVLAVQWSYGWRFLVSEWRRVLPAIAAPTAYLWLADRIALGLGLWTISDVHTIGFAPLGLPFEEAAFFLVTNVFIVQGLSMYFWLVDRLRETEEAAAPAPLLETRLNRGDDP